jgi:hypothetical protein
MNIPTHKSRKPYPSVRQPLKTVFTPAIWAHWMVEKGWLPAAPDETTLHLRACGQSIAALADRYARFI